MEFFGLMVAVFFIWKGFEIRVAQDSREKYDKELIEGGFKPDSGWDSAFEARKSQARFDGNAAIAVGLLILYATFLHATQ